MSDVQKMLQSLSDEYQKLQGDLQTTVDARQRLEAQQQENLGVQKEFSTLDASATIYKLIGSVLLKQDRSEAVTAVDGRLEYIGNEIKRTEQQIKTLQDRSDEKKMEIYQLQSQMQSQQQQQQQQQGPAQAAVGA